MTAKTDEGGAANTAADSSADRESAPPGALPSIIVDPSMASEAAAAQSGETAKGAHVTNGSAVAVQERAPSAPPAPDASASDRLSVEDADRFASNFRPSWEPPAPEPVVPTAPRRAATDLGARGDDIARVPRSRKSGILLMLGAVSGFIGLGALALLSSRHTPPPSWESAPQQGAEPEPPSEAQPKEAQPQAVAPASPPQPAMEPVAPTAPAAPPSALAEAAPLAPADPAAVPFVMVDPGADQAPAITPVIAAPAIVAAPATEPSVPASAPQVAPEAPAPPPAQPVQPIAAPAQPEPVPVAAPKLVKVRISATPSDAELSLDGQSIPNPFEAEVMISGKHRVQAKASGHRSADVTVPFDQPQELALRLERLEPAKPRARRARSAPTPHKTTPPANRGAGFVSESPY